MVPLQRTDMLYCDGGRRATLTGAVARPGCEPFRLRGRWLAMPVWGILLVIIAAVICSGLCAYGMSTATRRARDRRAEGVYALRSCSSPAPAPACAPPPPGTSTPSGATSVRNGGSPAAPANRHPRPRGGAGRQAPGPGRRKPELLSLASASPKAGAASPTPALTAAASPTPALTARPGRRPGRGRWGDLQPLQAGLRLLPRTVHPHSPKQAERGPILCGICDGEFRPEGDDAGS
jgi:hypothetical protein